jgi:hypothetical protein
MSTVVIVLGSLLALGIVAILLVGLVPSGRRPTIAPDTFFSSPTRGAGLTLLQ